MSEREPKNEIIILANLTSCGSRRRDILPRQEGYDCIDLYQIHERHISTTQKCGLRTMATPALGLSLFCALAVRCTRTCTSIAASGMHAGPARLLSGDTKIVRVRLDDPTGCELRALFDDLDRHKQIYLKTGVGSSMRPESAHHQANR